MRTADVRASAAACSEALGGIEPMSRGGIDWLITIPADGAVPVGGVAPARISRLLSSLGVEWPVTVRGLAGTQVPYLVAHIRTPRGLRELSCPMPPVRPV